ncbi:tRNA1(Val) (adenine(37)-N6)-methyltransferase [Pedobacter xixiisoli]|uniref:tRNA1(Val) (adenine(37)-N6)-methyltransferase n=1 Tax=Pedobacter xixiisoli TaxID=1476464 RepID=A0A285ZPZ4_9SPHI|nr:methyltransferase [Pedobacter xixiisoli]SOD11715.1 tRNA1Val (adenine37-N6)-methyltransferase [Pedobacter xixiisoli]
MSSVFKFKQFEVDQDGCAMKINTDGVLLAALTESHIPKKILDIGTGTGVLALMMAQRFPEAEVHAVEIDEQASITAGRNFENSVFSKQLSVINTAIEQFNTAEKFDLIISNPPFFINDLRNTEEKKGIARHASEQFFASLLVKVNAVLADDGNFWFILPVKQAALLIENAKQLEMYASEIIQLHSDISKPAFRYIVNLNRAKAETIINHFYIYESEKIYTNEYKLLLKDFFLGY